MNQSNTGVSGIRESIDAFVEAFNVNDLDRVMSFFSTDAIYRPGDGSEHRGPAAIRRAFEPQFRGDFGAMSFDEHDRLIDEAGRKATIRWVCRHDLTIAKPSGLRQRLQHGVIGLVAGRRFGWEGLDVFHFDEAGCIVGKYTYANYSWPRLCRKLGRTGA